MNALYQSSSIIRAQNKKRSDRRSIDGRIFQDLPNTAKALPKRRHRGVQSAALRAG